jgi:hypothetical protein
LREREHAIDRFLVRDTDGDLQRIEGAGLDGVNCIITVAAIADEARFARGLRIFDRANDVALAQARLGTAMELQ